jgi:hypothetical protein
MNALKMLLLLSLMFAASSSYASFDIVSISQWINHLMTQEVIPCPVVVDPGQGNKNRVGKSKPHQ